MATQTGRCSPQEVRSVRVIVGTIKSAINKGRLAFVESADISGVLTIKAPDWHKVVRRGAGLQLYPYPKGRAAKFRAGLKVAVELDGGKRHGNRWGYVIPEGPCIYRMIVVEVVKTGPLSVFHGQYGRDNDQNIINDPNMPLESEARILLQCRQPDGCWKYCDDRRPDLPAEPRNLLARRHGTGNAR